MPEYGEVNAQVLQDVVPRVDRAFQAFFRRVKAGRHPAIPAFMGATATTPSPIPTSVSMAARGTIMVSGPVEDWADCRALVPSVEGTPKTVTVSREADGWYVCFSCADVPTQPLPATGQETGIDLGLEAFATTSNGERIFHPGWYRKAERALKMAQRRVSRRKMGSNRRRKA